MQLFYKKLLHVVLLRISTQIRLGANDSCFNSLRISEVQFLKKTYSKLTTGFIRMLTKAIFTIYKKMISIMTLNQQEIDVLE